MKEVEELRGVITDMRDSTEKAMTDFDRWTDRWIPYALCLAIGYFLGAIVTILRTAP
jgi:hypothetical protein